jgi:hypothetical protein
LNKSSLKCSICEESFKASGKLLEHFEGHFTKEEIKEMEDKSK